MKNWNFVFLVIFLTQFFTYANPLGCQEKYVRPDHVEPEIWKKVKPYFLPKDASIRPILDDIFSNSRVIFDLQSMLDAGFIPTPIQGGRAIVMRHPALEGYIIKTYLDTVPHTRFDWDSWINRITGANLIRKMINENGWRSKFKVAHKWIYPLPESSIPPEGAIMRHNFVLVVQDMDLAPYEETRTRWFELNNTKVLDVLYKITRKLGLRDCMRPRNIPWSNDGKIVFVDTESFDKDHVPFSQFNKRLNPDMLKYWIKLTDQ